MTDRPIPVSYTHLDVYKRQIAGGAYICIANILFVNVVNNITFFTENIIFLIIKLYINQRLMLVLLRILYELNKIDNS